MMNFTVSSRYAVAAVCLFFSFSAIVWNSHLCSQTLPSLFAIHFYIPLIIILLQRKCISWNFIFVNTLYLIFITQLNNNFVKMISVDIGGTQITHPDGDFGYYSETIKADIPNSSKIISVVPYGSFSAGIIVCSIGGNSFRLSSHNKVTLPLKSRYVYVFYI